MKVAATCDESGLPPFSALALIVTESKLDDGRDVPGYHPSVASSSRSGYLLLIDDVLL